LLLLLLPLLVRVWHWGLAQELQGMAASWWEVQKRPA
jgi:hypothetical protein